MNMKKIISLVLAVALLLPCVPQVLPVAEAVEIATPTVIYTVGDLGVEGAVIATSFDVALAQIAAKNKEWEPGSVVEIQFADSVRGGAENGLLFGQTTIWRNDGTKLPITLRGADPDSQYAAEIKLDAVGGWYACANDYTFTNLTITIGNQETDFYAGCGNITFENVNFKSSGRAIQTKQDQTDAYNYSLNAAKYICADADSLIDPAVSRIPAGDAWQNVRAYDAENGTNYGEGLCGTEYRGFYGDGVHDGDVGGGQYLNACVYFEVMTGISCLGNTWRPTDYTLDEELVSILQEAAHKAVHDIYGEDHYTGNWTDKVGNDNAWNVLILGSSNCAYLRDELQAIAEHAGIDTRVFHAYSSGVEITTQWNWIVNGNGKYDTHDIADGQDTTAESQKITDFIESYEWDCIITYQTAGEFNDELPYTEEGWANVIADLKYADDFYNWMHDYCPDADYYWYQTVAVPYGVPATDGFEGRIFADNCTQAVFSGWDALEEGEKVHTSVTFGNNVNFKDNETTRVAAVGYLETAPEAAYTDATARQVKYLEATGYDDIADIRPADVHASVIIDGEENLLGHVNCKLGYAPSDASLVLKNGDVFRAHAAGIKGVSAAPYYGDVTMEYYKDIEILNWTGITTDITGDVTMIYDGYEWAKNMSTVAQGITVDGDFTVDIRDGNLDCSIYVAGHGYTEYSTITGTVTFRWGGGHIGGIYAGRKSNVGNLTNEFYCNPDAEIPASTDKSYTMAGASTCVVAGTVSNTYIGEVPNAILSKISLSGGDGSHSKIVNTVKADQNGNVPSFTSFCGGVTTGTVTEIVNNIEAGTFTTFNGGSTVATGTTKITNNISGGTFSADTTFGGTDSATVNTVITGGTFAFDPTEYVADGYKVKTDDGSTYTVTEEKILVVQTLPNKTIYSIGEELDATGLELALIGGSGSVETVTSGYELTGFNADTAGKTTVTVTYGEYTTSFGLAIVDDSSVMVDNSGNVYTDLSTAVQNTAASSELTLLQNVEADVTVDKDLYLDLNGNTITGTVTVSEGCTLYGMDHQTDDFTVADGLGYGVIGTIIGNVVAIPVEENGYLMLGDDTDDDGVADQNVSFHRVDLNLTDMTLRAKSDEEETCNPSMYYKSNFAGDEIVKANVKTFGVALSLVEEPNADNMGVTNKFSWFDGKDFVAGGNDNDATSTLLHGIMKEENGRLTKTSNATRPIYGRAYMQLDDGSYVFGASYAGNLKTLVEGVNDKWDSCTAEQKQAVLTMYVTYERIMKNWDIPAIIKAAE
ncbi:MAG: bacterial Ig-like domain-containing protein [Oscillospiraceae bacterium]|nr:bacterial Ig-like domain-containing protein [Oscillospiraceae bacterium]